jgi:DNA-binding NtrC family response regulator
MPTAKRTILIVDDDKSILRVFTRVLEKKGYAVTATETGAEALSQIAQYRFDAALIDVRLPDMDGTSILPKIQETAPKTVKVVFTGCPDLECVNKGERKLMDAFLIKPVKPEVLLAILDEKLKARA